MFRTNTEATAVEMFQGVVRQTLNSGDLATLIEMALAASVCIDCFSPVREEYL